MSDEQWRLFVSISVPDVVRNTIDQVQKRMQESIEPGSVRWTRNEQIHLTLKFLGNVRAGKVHELIAALTQATKGFSCFEVRSKGLGFFPSTRPPKVVRAGIESDQELLLKLQAAVAHACDPFTNERENRIFSGHLTLGRVKQISRLEADRLRAFRDSTGDVGFGQWLVNDVALMRSELSQAGARHTCAASFQLHS